MDAAHFDRLTTTFATRGTRRALTRLLLSVPLLGGLDALLGAAPDIAAIDDDHGSSHRRRRRKTRHTHRRHTHRHTTHRHNHKTTPTRPNPVGCTPESVAQTCAGKCARVANTCGTIIDCGPCACGTCAACTSCNPNTGTCDAAFEEQACGSPGQVCQAGICACKEGSCADGQHCDGTACVCDDQSCATGCCDDAGTCHIDDNTACGIGGGVCISCTGQGQTCGGGVTPGQCGCTSQGCGSQTCGSVVDNCGNTIPCAGCAGCCAGSTCQPGTADTACGVGGTCNDCTRGRGQTWGGGVTPTPGVCGCIPVPTTLTVPATGGSRGQELPLSATLREAPSEAPVPGQPIIFTGQAGTQFFRVTGTTDATGTAVVVLELGGNAANYAVSGVFAGTPCYGASTGTAVLTVT